MNLLRAVMFLAFVTSTVSAAADPALPHLERRGAATQLIVDAQPYLVLGGETANTASSSLEYMATVWPRLRRMNLNTGDDILLRYDLAAAAEKDLSGSGLRFFGPTPSVQHVTLYRYR